MSKDIDKLRYAEKIKSARITGNYSQYQIAYAVGTYESTYGKWERGKCSPQRRFKKRLDDFLFKESDAKAEDQKLGIMSIYQRMLKEFGEEITQRRLAKGLSQGAVAKAVGVRNQNVCSWESGRYFPGMENLTKLDALLGAETGEEADQ